MKICVLLPDEPKDQQAGLRIRYQRITPALRRLGHELTLLPVQNLTPGTLGKYDCYFLSKCYDTRALVALHSLRAADRPVGVDLFDDYFSQVDDSRFVRLRYWFREVLARCDFALCSTPRMRELVAEVRPTMPVHVMNDAAQDFDVDALRSVLARKLATLSRTGLVPVLWFGIGDNPNFPVGLSDLAAFGEVLDRMRNRGLAVHLKILTNQRAMTANALARLRTLASEWHLEEWSEARERELLDEALVAFLPVNCQNFSVAKSLNRAVTALSAGTQVLSAGFPLYAPLDKFIYRNPLELLADLRNGLPRLRDETADALAARFKEVADPEVEAGRLAEFLNSIKSKPRQQSPGKVAVIHGKETLGDVHKFTQRLGGLSVASPLTQSTLHYDLSFRLAPAASDLELTVSNKHVARLEGPWRREGEGARISLQALFRDGELGDALQPVLALLSAGSIGAHVAAYPQLMQIIVRVLTRLFPDVACLHSEQTRDLPWQVPGDAHG